tara:strand:+ start:228 stop:953 length:726 start_codon:yes stop_codon:yes gene_type:complete
MPYTIPRPQTLPNWHLKEGTTNGKLTGGDSLKKVSATVSSWQTCSKHCPMFNSCYAKKGFHTRQNANAVTTKGRGSDFEGFLENIENLRNNSFLRLSVSGDLPSEDWCYSTEERKIDLNKLKAIKKAVQSTKTLAFTYTHLHCDPKHKEHNLKAVKEAANKDLVINISVESKSKALKMKQAGFDVALVDSKTFKEAKEGNAPGFFACPAQYKDENGEKSRCIDCKKCSMFNRDEIVVFDKD